MSFGKYQFLSWARRGMASQIAEKDTLALSAGEALERAKVNIKVKINEAEKEKDFLMLGPGDITGVQSDMIIRTEPLNNINDFEPNLLSYIEFYDEDFPWRYTPAGATGPDNIHLRPWLALFILKEGEFTDTDRRKPLASIKVLNPEALPPADEAYLWAHMHSNLANSETGLEQFIEHLGEEVKTDPDGVYSRLMCPRKLEPNVLYHAFLVPAFETGRLAGLERPVKDIKAQLSSWIGGDNEFPVYYRWQFRTGENFDFEYLVKLLEPRVMDPKVGMRPMDCSQPGFIQADENLKVTAPLPNVMLLEGALKSPSAVSTEFPPAGPVQPFLQQIEKLVNLNRINEEHLDEDPVISIPYYGMHHAMRKDLSSPGKKVIPAFETQSSFWYNDLNRDPRNRTPAGFGVRVVQDNQESFMDQAWKQLQDLIEANKRMRQAQLMAKVMERMYAKNVAPLPEAKVLALTRGISARILMNNNTIRNIVHLSRVPDALFMPTFQRMARNNTALTRSLNIGEGSFQYQNLVSGINNPEGGYSAAPAAQFIALNSINTLATFTTPLELNNLTAWSIQSNLDTQFVFNLQNYQGGLPNVTFWNQIFNADIIFNFPFNPVIQPNLPGIVNRGLGDVTQLELAYTNNSFRFEYREPIAESLPLAVNQVASQTLVAIQPKIAYKKLLDSVVKWPVGLKESETEEKDFLPAMAYPDFSNPAYKYLVDKDKELLLPNLDLIPQNTLSLLRTNQKFIESYLVGLNYEMARELLWREYPTDMRGTYFRQFWDVRGLITPQSTSANANDLKDIEPIHLWKKDSTLGSHNAQDKEGDSEQLVFVIRGDLLKKFPNTVIYAQKAFKDPQDNNKKIIHTTLSDSDFKKEVLFPQYQAELPPDIKLLGFDLTIEQAAGLKDGKGFTDNLGWFFIIAEVPGEPRFGMDITYNPNEHGNYTWNDLSWENFNGQALSFITKKILPGDTGKSGGQFTPPANASVGLWGKSSADMAGILLQRPVMIAVHSTEMLDVKIPETGATELLQISLLQHLQPFLKP